MSLEGTMPDRAGPADSIAAQIAKVRRLLHECAVKFKPFEPEIVRVLRLPSIAYYGFIIDCFYLFEDTELAKEHVRRNGVATPGDRSNMGLVYLKFYGLMNACYLQQEAIVVCAKKLHLNPDLAVLKSSKIIQYRNDFAAHSPNRGRDEGTHSFILDRFGLTEGRISGYSSNSPGGIAFRDANVADLIADWDEVFLRALSEICNEITTRILAEGIQET